MDIENDGDLYPLAVEGADVGESSTDYDTKPTGAEAVVEEEGHIISQPSSMNGASSPKSGRSYAAATAGGSSPKLEHPAEDDQGPATTSESASASAAEAATGEASPADTGPPARPGSATQRSPAGAGGQGRRSSGTVTPPRKVCDGEEGRGDLTTCLKRD
jgi:hypothetical protein